MASRLTKKPTSELTPDQRAQHERIARFRTPGADGQFGGPFDPWVRSPELAQRAVSWGNFIWERTTLERRIVEFAISVTAWAWESNVEWVAHARAAKQYGVSDETLASVLDGRRPEGAPPDELATYDFCVALHRTHHVPADVYKRAVASFGEQGVVEMIAAIGYYTFVSMTLNAFEIPVGDGVKAPFPR